MNLPKVPIGEILIFNDKIYLGTTNGNVDITQKKDYFFIVSSKEEIANLTPEERNAKNLYFSINDCIVYSFVGGIEDVNITPIVMNVNCFEQDNQEAKFWYNITEGSLKYRNNNNEIIDLNAVILSVHDHTNLSDLEKVSGSNTGDETRNSIIEKIGFEVSPEGHTHTDILGNAATADKLKNPIAINGIVFDGSKDINIKPSNIVWNYLFRTITDNERDSWNNKQGKDTNLSAILALEESNGILRKSGFGSWFLDNSEYALISEVMKTTGDQSVSGTKTFNGDVYISGNIYQQGALYETHAEKVYTKNDFITLREGAISGLNTGYTGLVAKLYDGVNDGQLVFDVNGIARVGDVGSTQAIATREDNPVNGKVPIWNSTTMMFETANSPTTLAGYGITNAVDTSSTQGIGGTKAFLHDVKFQNVTTFFSWAIFKSHTSISGKFAIGSEAAMLSDYGCNIYGKNTASLLKWTNTVTGQLATDGLDIGLASDGTAEIRQRENLPINEYTNNTLRRTITGGGYHLFNGSSAPRAYVFGTAIPRVQIEGTDLPSSSLAITRNSADTSASCFYLGKSRGTIYNSLAQVNDGDFLSAIYFTGADGTQMVNAGSITARVNGTPSAGNIPVEVSINIGSMAVITAKADGSTAMSSSVNIPTGQNYNINGVALRDVSETLTNKTLSSPTITGTPTGITAAHVGLGNVKNLDTSNPANITWTTSYRTVTDTEKTTWNGKQNALGYTAENSVNKKTVWQTTPDNTSYPSEKLVKDSLDLKVDKVTGKQLSTEDYTTAEKSKLSGVAAGANNYIHPTGDGNSHIPATGTTNNGKVLKAGATANSASWSNVAWSEVTNKPTSMPASDVYAWAKAATKPTYTFAEIGSPPTTLTGYGITDANSEKWSKITVSGDANKYYPVVFNISGIKNRTINIKKDVHNYATWDGALTLEVEVQSGGFGGHAGYTNIKRLLHAKANPVKYFVASVSQSINVNDYLIIWLLGGGRTYNYNKNLETDQNPIVYYTSTTLSGNNGTVDVKTAVDSAFYQTSIVPADNYNYVKNSDIVTTATANKILKLDANAKLPANITGNADGNAATATKLQTARTINGISFDGSANITIPKIHSRGQIACETGVNRPALSGVSTQSCYSNGYPITYGEVLTLDGRGSAQLLLGWSGGTAPAYIRSKRDISESLWSDWHMIYTTAYKPSLADLGAASSSHAHAFSEITSKPTTLAGYGITDAVSTSQVSASNVASKVVQRDGAGDVTVRLIRAEYANQADISGGLVFRTAGGSGTDNYLRVCNNVSAIRTFLGVPSTAVATTSVNGLMSNIDKTKLNNLVSQYLLYQNTTHKVVKSSSTSLASAASSVGLGKASYTAAAGKRIRIECVFTILATSATQIITITPTINGAEVGTSAGSQTLSAGYSHVYSCTYDIIFTSSSSLICISKIEENQDDTCYTTNSSLGSGSYTGDIDLKLDYHLGGSGTGVVTINHLNITYLG